MQINGSTSRVSCAPSLALAEQRNFTRAAAAMPPVAAGVQRADPRARGRRSARACSTAARAASQLDGRRRRLFEGAGAARCCADVRQRASPACATTRRGAAAGSRWRCCRRSPPAGCRRCWPRFRAQPSGHRARRCRRALGACIERVRDGAGRLRARRRRAPRRPSCSAEVFCSRRLPSRLPRRPSAGAGARADQAARPRAPGPSSTCRAPAACASTSTPRFHPQAMHTVMEVDQLATVMGMVRAGLGISVVPALTLFHFEQPEIATRPVHLPGLARRIYLVRRRDRQPVAGGAGAARPGARRAAGDHRRQGGHGAQPAPLASGRSFPGADGSATAAGDSSPRCPPSSPCRLRSPHVSARFALARARDRGAPRRSPALARLRGPRACSAGCSTPSPASVPTAARGRPGKRPTKPPGTWRRRCCSAPWRCLGCAGCSGASGRLPARLGAHALGALAFASLWHLLDFALSELVLRPRPCGRDLRAAGALAHAPGRCSSTPRWSRASAARCMPAAPIAPRWSRPRPRRRWCGPSWRRSAASSIRTSSSTPSTRSSS